MFPAAFFFLHLKEDIFGAWSLQYLRKINYPPTSIQIQLHKLNFILLDDDMAPFVHRHQQEQPFVYSWPSAPPVLFSADSYIGLIAMFLILISVLVWKSILTDGCLQQISLKKARPSQPTPILTLMILILTIFIFLPDLDSRKLAALSREQLK